MPSTCPRPRQIPEIQVILGLVLLTVLGTSLAELQQPEADLSARALAGPICSVGALLFLLYWTIRPEKHARPLLLIVFGLVSLACALGVLGELFTLSKALVSLSLGLALAALLALVAYRSFLLAKALLRDAELRTYFDGEKQDES